MNRFIIATLMVLASVFVANAQRTQNEGVVAYNYIRQDVKFERPTFKFNENTDSHGFNLGYTRYTKGGAGKVGILGLTGELAANFNSNEASVATAMVGGIAKARNNSVVQPYVRVLAGVARQHVNRKNIKDTTDITPAFDAGVGVDFAVKKGGRNAIGLGLDYLNTGFQGQRQDAVRGSLRFVF